MHDLSTTLVAVATPAGRGGVGCVRLSGSRSGEIASRLFRPAGSRRFPGDAEPPRFGRFLDREGRPLDHGFLVLFSARRAYSGEASAELWAHGSPAVLTELVEAAVAAGAVPAEPGEFAYRAVRHGRLDLTRAEAVHDLVAARTRFQARVALAQAEGSVARRLQPLQQRLEEWIARGEAALEFVEESETHLPRGSLERAVRSVDQTCRGLLEGFRAGRVLRDGARLAIVGRPNAGKSSLFNRLLQHERAIVTEVAGTTRDTLEEVLDLDGIPVRLIDTAGLRQVRDRVESEGIRRARQARADADLVLCVLDGSVGWDEDERAAVREAAAEPDGRTVVVSNKCDLPGARPDAAPTVPAVSALTGEGVDALRAELRRRLTGAAAGEDPTITNVRHAAALERTRQSLAAALAAAERGLSEECVLEDLREARRQLGSITGEFTTDDLYDGIFARFCIGK